MSGHARALGAALLASLSLAVTGCGSGSHAARRTRSGITVAPATAAVQDTVTMVTPTFPDSLDPQAGDSPQSTEATWVAYTGLVSYAHRSGTAGARLIPGLATTLPRITHGGATYTVTLRRGLAYSDGRPVRATDFVFSLERAVRLWPGAPALLDHTVTGAAAFAAGRARTISGVAADDRTGRITIRLTAPDGAFDAVLAAPALGLIAAGDRPFAVDPRDPPPGCGPYVIERVVPGRAYTLARNPHWRPLPGIPDGRVTVDVRASADVDADADAVLNDTADLLDWTAALPAGLVSELRAKAAGRFAFVDTGASTDYVFLDRAQRPFASALARRAVVVALDHDRLDRLAAGTLGPACLLLGPVLTGPLRSSRCPDGAGNLAAARGLMRRSGEIGQPVVVASPPGPTARALMTYYVRLLNAIGLRAQLSIGDSDDAVAAGAQTGLETFTAGADPAGELARRLGDPGLDAAIARLRAAASPGPARWQRIDEQIARRADVAVLGDVRFPFLASARMDYPALEINPVYGWDFTSLRLR